jgi:hypothetical protein
VQKVKKSGSDAKKSHLPFAMSFQHAK